MKANINRIVKWQYTLSIVFICVCVCQRAIVCGKHLYIERNEMFSLEYQYIFMFCDIDVGLVRSWPVCW